MQTTGKNATTRILMDKIVRLETNKAELLEVLEAIWHAPQGPNLAGSIQAMRDKARTAIAKAKDET